jgi:hypothetical protein
MGDPGSGIARPHSEGGWSCPRPSVAASILGAGRILGNRSFDPLSMSLRIGSSGPSVVTTEVARLNQGTVDMNDDSPSAVVVPTPPPGFAITQQYPPQMMTGNKPSVNPDHARGASSSSSTATNQPGTFSPEVMEANNQHIHFQQRVSAQTEQIDHLRNLEKVIEEQNRKAKLAVGTKFA